MIYYTRVIIKLHAMARAHDYSICPMKGCLKKNVNYAKNFGVCEDHVNPISCQHCATFQESAKITKRVCGKVGVRILCNKCFDKYAAVKFKYPVCFFLKSCMEPQIDGSVFCNLHKKTKLCSLCLGYGNGGDVAEYKNPTNVYCGQCIKKIYTVYLQDKDDVTPPVLEKIEKLSEAKRHRNNVKRRKLEQEEEPISDDEAEESEHSDYDPEDSEDDPEEDQHPELALDFRRLGLND